MHDGANIITEYESDHGGARCTAQYVSGRGPDSRYQIAAGGRGWFYHKDGVGSTGLLTDGNGGMAAYDYAPFGQLVRARPAAGGPYNRYLFGGRRYDDQIAAYDFRARVYAPVWGRFLQRDPAGAGGTNLYAYTGNNPLSYADPYGLDQRSTVLGQDSILALAPPRPLSLRTTPDEFELSFQFG